MIEDLRELEKETRVRIAGSDIVMVFVDFATDSHTEDSVIILRDIEDGKLWTADPQAFGSDFELDVRMDYDEARHDAGLI